MSKLNTHANLVSIVVMAFLFTGVVWSEPILYDNNYQIESYASYSSVGRDKITGSCFDDEGNLYLTYSYDASIARVSSTNVTTHWADNLAGPAMIVWTGGTAYGDSLYVMENFDSKVRVLDDQGNHSVFASVNRFPLALGIDKYGNYGNQLFGGTSDNDGIYSISTSGSVSQFGTFPGDVSGGLRDIEFSPTAKYGGEMFVHLWSSDAHEYLNGIYSIDTSGNASRFASSVNVVWDLAFDTAGTQFGNDLFAIGSIEGLAGNHILRIDESGNATSLALLDGISALSLTFGLDGAMYVSTTTGDNYTDIYRISEVPEPASLLLLGLGGMLLRKKRKLS